ncbi:MAG TPA: hypothetical protein VK832_20795 [Burkholderiaceae bacterium]|jgi:hypothetical protein|nr:hypothetical protein [Burkholderiaceae bacterium]
MNSTRIIEGATLMSIGVFCASALLSFALHSSNLMHGNDSSVAMVELPTVTVSAKRLNAVEKAALLKEVQETAAKVMVVGHSTSASHAG